MEGAGAELFGGAGDGPRGSWRLAPSSHRLVGAKTHKQRNPKRDVMREDHRRGRQPPETSRAETPSPDLSLADSAPVMAGPVGGVGAKLRIREVIRLPFGPGFVGPGWRNGVPTGLLPSEGWLERVEPAR